MVRWRPLYLVLLALAAAAGFSQSTSLVSRTWSGGLGNFDSQFPSISHDGSWIAFASSASNLVPGATDPRTKIYVANPATGQIALASPAFPSANGDSFLPRISGNGRYVVFASGASNLVANDTNARDDVFRYDRMTGQLSIVSVSVAGLLGNGNSTRPAVSTDGRFVVFSSSSTNLVSTATSDSQVYLKDMTSGTVRLISRTASGTPGNDGSYEPALSGNADLVAFMTDATNLVPGDTNNRFEVLIHRVSSNTTERATFSPNGAQADSYSGLPAVSADGRYVSFWSGSSNLINNGTSQICVYRLDTATSTISRVSATPSGAVPNGASYASAISGDGSVVAFHSEATNILPSAANGSRHVYWVDLTRGQTQLISQSTSQIQGNGKSDWPSVSLDGASCVFDSSANNLVAADSNGRTDIFLRQLPGSEGLSLRLRPQRVAGGGTVQGTVVLSRPAGGSGLKVALRSSVPELAVCPLGVFLPAGAIEVSFAVSTTIPAADTTCTITATSGTQSSQAELVVTPAAPLPLPDGALTMRNWQNTAEVVGIACDNNPDTPDNWLNFARFVLASNYDTSTLSIVPKVKGSTSSRPDLVGVIRNVNGVLAYVPPSEFNLNKRPATLRDLDIFSTREMEFRVSVKSFAGQAYMGKLQFWLVRPPVVFVHGINSSPDIWFSGSKGGMAAMLTQGFIPPMVFFDHSHAFNGRGYVETAARNLQDQVDSVIAKVNSADRIPVGIGRPLRGVSNREFFAYANLGRISSRRVDLVAHSCGGVVSRWMISGPRDSSTEIGRRTSVSGKWYKLSRDLEFAVSPRDGFFPIYKPYQGQVRKLITLGSMWRGVPLCNMLNEVNATGRPGEPLFFGTAPLRFTLDNLAEKLVSLEPVSDYHLPTWQVMGVQSNWLGHLNRNGPFAEDVRYGSVAGGRSQFDFLDKETWWGRLANSITSKGLYSIMSTVQSPSWFPFFQLEVQPNENSNDGNDNIVPIWSAALPGPVGQAHRIVNANHSGMLTDEGAVDYVGAMLNSLSLPNGEQLAKWWRDPVQAPRNPRTGAPWVFDDPSHMAPSPQNVVYQSVGGMGRFSPSAVRNLKDVVLVASGRRYIIRFRVPLRGITCAVWGHWSNSEEIATYHNLMPDSSGWYQVEHIDLKTIPPREISVVWTYAQGAAGPVRGETDRVPVPR